MSLISNSQFNPCRHYVLRTHSNSSRRKLLNLLLLLLCGQSFIVYAHEDEQQYSYASDSPNNAKQYVNQFAIEIEPGPNADNEANIIAQELGYINKGQVCNLIDSNF